MSASARRVSSAGGGAERGACDTYGQQSALYSAFLAEYGASTSSHELGTAVDVDTPEMRWVIDQIGWKYGWTRFTGPGEWWHVDDVGG